MNTNLKPYSNTTLVKVKYCRQKIEFTALGNSNTTLVKVKCRKKNYKD